MKKKSASEVSPATYVGVDGGRAHSFPATASQQDISGRTIAIWA